MVHNILYLYMHQTYVIKIINVKIYHMKIFNSFSIYTYLHSEP